MEKHSGVLGRAVATALVVSMVMTVFPASVLGLAPESTGPGQKTDDTGPADPAKVIPKFWVEPAKPYAPPPVTAASSRDAGRGVNGYAVLMGINAYPSAPLQGCISDITAIRDRLVNSYGWSNASIHFVTDSAVTPARVIQEIQWLASVADSSSQTVFSFSGHGSAHTIWAYPMNGVSDTELATELKKLRSSENICILDSCFSGANTAVNITSPPFLSMMACGPDETAADGATFTKAWVEGLGTTQWGEAEDAFTYAYNQIQGWQHPVMWDNIPGKLMLARRPPVIQGTVPNLTAPEDTPVSITLTNYESDPVDGHAQLTWSASWVDSSKVEKVLGQGSANDTLAFFPSPNWNGKTTVTLMLTNSAGRTAKQNITINWTPVNDLPVVRGFDRLWPSVERTRAVKLVVYGSDVDNDNSTLTIEAEYRPAGGKDWAPAAGRIDCLKNHWEFDFVPPASCPLGAADIRARLRDLEGWCGWTSASGFIQILNSPPVVSALNISGKGVHRTQNLTIYLYGSDAETSRDKLGCDVELKSANETAWTRVTRVSLSGERWSAVFEPSPKASLGAYDLRARLWDADAALGDWKEMYDCFNVENALPVLRSMELSASTTERGAPVLLTVRGGDVEDPLPLLTCDVHYKNPTGSWARLENVTVKGDHWEATFLPLSFFKAGDYSFRAVLRDTTGQLSEWLFLNSSLTVTNSLPRAGSINFSKTSVLRTQNISLRIEGKDYEDRSSNLTCEVAWRAGDTSEWQMAGIENIRYDDRFYDWVCTFTPAASLPAGSYSLGARLKDREGDWGEWFSPDQKVSVLNNPPVARIAPHPDVVNEKCRIELDAAPSTDIEGALDCHWEFGDGSTDDGELVTHIYSQGGQKEVVLTVTDSDGAASEARLRLRVNLLPAAQATCKQFSGVDDFRVSFDASGSTDAEGAIVAYVWDFDNSVDSDMDGRPDNDMDSSSPYPTFDYRKEGIYTARLTVVDADNGSSSVLILVNVKRTAPQDDTMMYMLLALVIVALAAAGAAAAIRSRARRPR